jgi:pyrroline-5-carboxylate reductase
LADKKIGLIGCGNMGEALLAGLVKNQKFRNEDIFVSEKQEDKLNSLKSRYTGINFTNNNKSTVENSSVIIIAVKPQDIEVLLEEISHFLKTSQLLISIAAGIKISSIEKNIPAGVPVVRVMPNLPALTGEGISAYCTSKAMPTENEEIVEKILGSSGKVIKLEEEKLDAVTAISGSGPAYVFYMLEAMAEAGTSLGLTKEQSKDLSVQTILGAVKMIEQGEDPATLREKVTSPNGTTEAALKVLFEKKWKEILIEAIKKAEQRSKELSK